MGSSILLTTHYLGEAEHLCDLLMIMAAGSAVKEGTLDDLRDSSKVTGYIDFDCVTPDIALSEETTAFVTVVETHPGVRASFSDLCLDHALGLVHEVEDCGRKIETLSIRPRMLEEGFIEVAEDASVMVHAGRRLLVMFAVPTVVADRRDRLVYKRLLTSALSKNKILLAGIIPYFVISVFQILVVGLSIAALGGNQR